MSTDERRWVYAADTVLATARLAAAPVEKTTGGGARMKLVSATGPFGFRTWVPKEDVWSTAHGAVASALQKARADLERVRTRVQALERLMDTPEDELARHARADWIRRNET